MKLHLLLASGALALVSMVMHPALTTSAEIELDVDSGKLEVAVYFTPRDLERALTAAEGRPVRLDKEAKIDTLIENYVDGHFDLILKDGTEATFTWVGQESKLRDTWVYFELDAKGSLQDCKLRNTLLEGLGAEYISTVTFAKAKGGKKSLRFDAEQKKLALD
jgi:Leu/Phe-tRNA-protein transferase